jgi:hypothetical protein
LLNWPALHARQTVDPAVGATNPGGHSGHDRAPGPLLKLPGSQALQGSMPVGLKKPAWQL